MKKKCYKCKTVLRLKSIYQYPVYIDGKGYMCAMCHNDLLLRKGGDKTNVNNGKIQESHNKRTGEN